MMTEPDSLQPTVPPAKGQEKSMTSGRSDVSRKWSYVLLVTGCAIALTLLIASQYQSSLGLQTLKELGRQTEKIGQLAYLQILLVEAETSVRGYLLTSELVYLESYERTAPKIDAAIDQLHIDFARYRSVDVAALTMLVRAKWKVMSEAVARRARGEATPDDMVGKILMDEVRGQLARLRDEVVSEGRAIVASSSERFRLAQQVGAALALIALILLLILFSVVQRQFALRKRVAEMLASENERLESQVRKRTMELRNLARHITNAREDEKARLARELHDELGALLTAAKLDADWIARKLPDNTQETHLPRVNRLQRTLAEGIAIKRRIIDDLRPPLLKELGVIEALRALASDAPLEHGTQVETDLPDSAASIDSQRALTLFRIAQEAFTNAHKYANASHLKLSLKIDGTAAHLSVADNGRGFAPTERSRKRHGIDGMEHRVQAYGGSFVVRSAPGEGTTVSASIPLH